MIGKAHFSKINKNNNTGNKIEIKQNCKNRITRPPASAKTRTGEAGTNLKSSPSRQKPPFSTGASVTMADKYANKTYTRDSHDTIE